MRDEPTTLLATAIVFGTGAIWGLYWLPVRELAGLGLPGPWGTVAITLAATVLLLPTAILHCGTLIRTNRVALVSVALGGAAFALYSIGFVYGRVAIIILLYFLTPVWSTLIGRYMMGWHTPRSRMLAIVVGLAGLATMLGADGEFPLPRGAGEWMALIAGMLWSVGTTGIRATSDLKPVLAAFVFALGGSVTALALAAVLVPWPGQALPGNPTNAIGVAVATGTLWWVLSIAGLMWAAVRLDPARVGILLMTEVLIGAASAALLAGEHLSAFEVIGGALVLFAGGLEVWPIRADRTPPG